MTRSTSKNAPNPSVSPYSTLPFFAMRRRPRKGQFPRNFWSVQATGDYDADIKTGEAYALLFLSAEEASASGTVLPHVVSDMPKDAELSGLEVGFLQIIGFAAIAGAGRAREISAYWARCEAERATKKSAKTPK